MRFLFYAGMAMLLTQFPAAISAQDRAVRGVAVDSAGKPIPGAGVSLNDSRTMVITDQRGRFRLPLTRQSECIVQFRRNRYRTVYLDLPTCSDTTIQVVMAGSHDESGSGPRCGTRSTGFCQSPVGLRFQAISAGQAHTCGITADGVAWCWGDGRKAALGNGAVVQRWPTPVATHLRFLDIAAGGNFTCGISTDGVVYCWGTSEVVPGWPKGVSQPTEIGWFGVEARLTAGRRHACVLDAQGRAHCWGWNVDGETGTGSSGVTSSLLQTPALVAGDYRFTSLSAGLGFTCGTTTAQRLLCWGSNVDHILGSEAPQRCGEVGPVPCSAHPVLVEVPEPLRQVSSGTTHACAISITGAVYCWGSNGHGQLGSVRPTIAVPQVLAVPPTERFASIASGGIESCGVTTGGNLYCWGADPRRRNATDLSADDVRPRLVARDIRSVSMGQGHSCAVTRANRVLCWGDTILGAFGTR